MILAQVKRLAGFANTRAVVAGLTMIHVTEKGEAFATDGEIELYIPNTLLPAEARWSVVADTLLKVANAAGADAVADLQLDAGKVLVYAGRFAAQVDLAGKDSHLSPAYRRLLKDPKKATVWQVADSVAFTDALRLVGQFAATDAASGAHWTAVLLRNGSLYASDRGFSVARATVDGAPNTGKDVLIPARACALITEAKVKSLTINEADGIGSFELTDGAHIVFRTVAAPEKGYPDAERLLATMPGDGHWAAMNDSLRLALAQAAAVLKTDHPVLRLSREEGAGWFVSASGIGEASVDLPDFECPNGEPLLLPLVNWNLLTGCAAEIAPMGDHLLFRSVISSGKGKFSVAGRVAAFIESEE